MLFLYLITQDENTFYDTYDSAVVVATSAAEAKIIQPWGGIFSDRVLGCNEWTNPENVKVKIVGVASASLKAGEVVCSSYNAG